jgi:aminodeoxychorismate lyase
VVAFINGKIVPEEQAVVSVLDRCFLYGDGLFETIRVHNGKPFRWGQHIDRLVRSAESLKITVPHSGGELKKAAEQLITQNQATESLIRVQLSRGVGVRGYSPKNANEPTIVMTTHPMPEGMGSGLPQWQLITSSFRVPANDELAQHKTCSRLTNVLARAEAEAAGADEALILNSADHVVESAGGNLFWIYRETICTPPHALGALPGVTRAVVMEICNQLNLRTKKLAMKRDALLGSEGAFLSLSSWGIVEIASLDGNEIPGAPVIGQIAQAYDDLLKRECS